MDTYEVKMKSPRVNLKYRFIAALCFAALLFLMRFGWSILSPTSREVRLPLPRAAIETGAWSLLMGLGMVFFRLASPPSYKLLVDEKSMTWVMEYTGWMGWF